MISVPERVKDALRDGRLLKTYRFNVLNDDGTVDFTIDNDTLVYESVKFDERMCSGDTLKFGLCEGSSLEFQYFDHDNITGRQLQCFIDVQYKDADGELSEHTIPMGFFTVKKCSRQASTGIQKVTAYNKLQSEYLDQKANTILLEDFGGDGSTTLTLYDIQKHLLSDYEILTRPESSIPVSINPYILPITHDLYNWYFNDVDNTDTPLSAYEFSKIAGSSPSMGTELKLEHGIIAGIATTTADQYFEIDFLKGDIETFVDSYINYATDIIVHAHFRKQNNVAVTYTRAEIESHLRGIGLIRIRVDNEWYILTENPKETMAAVNNLIHSGVHNIYFTLPESLGMSLPSDRTVTNMVVSYINQYQYQYRNNGSIITKTATPTVVFSDGTPYTGVLSDIFAVRALSLSKAEKVTVKIEDLPEFSLRDIVGANYETQCQYGQLNRETDLFSGVELNHTALYPADTLYPANDLYPGGTSETSFKSWYSKLWTDTVGEQSFRKLIITYKGLDANNVPTDFIYETEVDPDGTTDYVMDDNWLFRNLIWTQADIESYAAAMVTKMQSIHWFPFEMWAAGLPYIETGDMIEIMVDDETHTSYILQRQLSGIQNLQDTYINGTLDIF